MKRATRATGDLWGKSLLAGVLLVYANLGSAAELDPTQPSSKLLDVLRPKTEATTADPDPEHVSLDQKLKMKAIVLRDTRHGTALVSFDNAQTFVVRLRRSGRVTLPTELSIGGTSITVTDFSAKWITFSHPDLKQPFTIR